MNVICDLCFDAAKKRKQGFAHFDVFGGNPVLNIDGKERFKTNIGAGWTVFFGMFFIAVCWFYLTKMMDKSAPIVQFNIYDSEEYLDKDLIKEDLHIYYMPISTRTGQPYSIAEFDKSFLFRGVIFNLTMNDPSKGGPPFQIAVYQ